MFLIDMLRSAVHSVTERIEHGRAIRQLRAMSDRELSDIGIVRAEIEAVVTGTMGRGAPDPALVRPTVRVANSRGAPAPRATLDAA